MKYVTALLILFFSASALSDGKITNIWMSGPDDPNHINIVQITIEGGFSTVGGCSAQHAAVRIEGREHLVSFILAAYKTEEPIKVVLNPADKYYADRCTISRVSSSY